MGTHYDFALTCRVRADVDPVVLETLQRMVGDVPDEDSFEPPQHEYSTSSRSWKTDFRSDRDFEYYSFPGPFGAASRAVRRRRRPDAPKLLRGHDLSLRCQMGDDHFVHTFWLFLMWLSPYSHTQGWVGYFRNDLEFSPTLVYFRDGQVLLLDLEHAAVPMPIDMVTGEPWPDTERHKGEPIQNC